MEPILNEGADVTVLGGGLAGHCAALEVSRAGARVILLEKAANFGGSSASGPGSFAFAGTDSQQRLGYKDSPEIYRADMRAVGHGHAREDLVDVYIANQLDTYHWLIGESFTLHMRVTDVLDRPIAGLYAAGEVAGGVHGASYLSGSSLGKCAIFGGLAGRAAARGGLWV